ncbi:MAG: TIGR01212 family radical SAM protein [Thermovibrio sp.]|nr:MAG: TIGR01212 family radical SAM protein [Thermovibrio sp.]
MERYFSFSRYLREIFKEKVFRITVDAGFTCPNRDGKKGTGGCIYCYSGSDYDVEKRKRSVEEQILTGMERVRRRYGAEKFLVYFQAYTNTYAPLDVLKSIYDTVRKFPDVVGIIVGTRPDCVPDETLELLNSYTDDYLVWIEYGLESSHYKSLRWMNRGHGVSDFIDAVLRTRRYPRINICSHVILGLPTEDYEDMMETADFISSLRIDGVKIHPLHVIRGTRLEEIYLKERFELLSLEEYVDLVVDFIERLPKRVVIQRITGEAPEELLIGPEWCSHREKNRVINLIRKRFEERDTFQGKKCRFSEAL